MNFDRIDFFRVGYSVIGVYVDTLSWSQTLAKIASWAAARESRYVCVSNVHSVVTASSDSSFGRVVAQADMVTPDGMPVAWMLRRFGFKEQQRINGPDLMWRYCELAQQTGDKVFFYGGSKSTLEQLLQRFQQAFPQLQVAGFFSPPYRDMGEAEDVDIVDQINRSGASVVFVGLGCPKQEQWMEEHRGRIDSVMIGVGAAFDFHAGVVKRAPRWMQNSGLEWLFRLVKEPGRLWKRYLITNTVFIVKCMHQLMFSSRNMGPRLNVKGLGIPQRSATGAFGGD